MDRIINVNKDICIIVAASNVCHLRDKLLRDKLLRDMQLSDRIFVMDKFKDSFKIVHWEMTWLAMHVISYKISIC